MIVDKILSIPVISEHIDNIGESGAWIKARNFTQNLVNHEQLVAEHTGLT